MKATRLLTVFALALGLSVPAAVAMASYQNYQVRPGDTWSSIASTQCRQGTQPAALAQYNQASVNTPLRPGQTVRIPNSLSRSRQATLQSFQGGVTINGRAASRNASLNQNDTIETNANGRADVVLDNGSVMRVGPNTRITLSQLSLNGRNANTATSMERGSVSMQVTRMNRGSSFQVSTVSAVAGVRGTYFYVNVDPDTNDVGIACYTGRVVVGRPVIDENGQETIEVDKTVDAGFATTINGETGAAQDPFPIPDRILWEDEAPSTEEASAN